MNKREIKRELRRSATEDRDPWVGCYISAWIEARKWRNNDNQTLLIMHTDDLRTFYLLVAEAL